jgi:chromate transporter
LGWISFGGPAGQIAIMHTELVDRRRWVDEGSFMRALNFCMLLPGPEAMQLATWLGWRLHGVRGGIVAGLLFVLPASLLLALLSWLYLRYGGVPAVAGVVFGLQAAVLGIIVQAARRIGGRVLKTPFAVVLAAAAWLALALGGWPFPLILLTAGAAGVMAWRYRPAWLPAFGEAASSGVHAEAPRSATAVGTAIRIAAACLLLWWLPILGIRQWLGADSVTYAMGLFFSKAALVTVGGAYAVLPYVADQAVQAHGWLSPAQMMVGLGLAETTPGPLILVLEFVGFVGGWQRPDLASPLASALLGAAITLWATFLPSFLFVLTAAPWIERIGRWPRASAMLAGVTAAVVGVIANLAIWFGWRLLAAQPWPAMWLALGIATLVYLGLSRWRWPVAAVVLGAGAVGAAAQFAIPLAT